MYIRIWKKILRNEELIKKSKEVLEKTGKGKLTKAGLLDLLECDKIPESHSTEIRSIYNNKITRVFGAALIVIYKLALKKIWMSVQIDKDTFLKLHEGSSLYGIYSVISGMSDLKSIK